MENIKGRLLAIFMAIVLVIHVGIIQTYAAEESQNQLPSEEMQQSSSEFGTQETKEIFSGQDNLIEGEADETDIDTDSSIFKNSDSSYDLFYDTVAEDANNYERTKTLAAPKKITNLKVVISGNNSLKLSWSKLSNVTGYRVYRSIDGRNFTYLKTLKGNNVLTYTDKNLAIEKKYYYKVRGYIDDVALGKRIYGILSDTVSATVFRVWQKIVNFNAMPSSYNSIRLSWSKLSGVTGYRVYRSTNGKDFTYLKTLKGTNILTYTDKSLLTGKTYYYKVRAYLDDKKTNKRYYGAFSAGVSAKPTLGKTTINSIVNYSEKKAKISWSQVTGANGYEIYQASSQTGTYTKVKTITSGSTLTYIKSNLAINETYYYKMRAYRTVDGSKVYGDYSNIKNVTIKDWVKETADSKLKKMTLEEKVAQLFVVTPESITGVGKAVIAGNTTKKAIQNYPVGGIIYFSQNIQNKNQFIQMVQGTQEFMQERANMKAFIAIDEEGGTVARISGNPNTGVPKTPSMSQIGATKDPNQAYKIGKTIGDYLSEFQINLDFAPVADIANLEGSIMLERSFGTDATLVGDMVFAQVKGFKEKNMICALKHFPGLGYTVSDTHLGYVKTDRTKSQMQSCEFIPFKKGIEAGADIVMVGHVSVPNLTGNDTPSSLSKEVITDILRNELGFQGLVVTDALGMKGVSQYYTSDEAAVKALQAGVDILLMPQNFQTAYNGVLKAVQNGTITEERINQSVYRILKLKAERGLM
ncbi:MAG: glycoside hydrolase family 3 N-terminal domain-containing protein [Lachnospiraceae bacterium]